MTVPAVALPRRARSALRGGPPVAAVGVAAAALLGLVVGSGRALAATALLVLVAAMVTGLQDWRRAVYGLLLFLPFSGIPYLLLYPSVRPALVLKDLVFVLPAYAGFLAGRGERGRVEPGVIPAVLLALFALLVAIQVFNPALPNRLVGLIGAKVWLFYVPCCLLAYHLVETRADLARLLGVMSVAAIVPALIGVAEAVLVYAGHPDLVYRWYGGAAESATQGFVQFNFVDGGSLRRIPSTFSFVAQYFGFAVSMVAVTYAWWRGFLARTRLAPVGAAIWLLLLLAGLLSGARAAFVFLPFLMAVAVLLEARGLRLPVGRLMVPSALLVGVTVVVLGAGAGTLLSHSFEVGFGELQKVFLDGFRNGIASTLTGLGTGIDTNAARYAFDQTTQFTGPGGTWYESWYVKAYVELGLAGLVLVVAILGQVLVAGLRRHAALVDPGLRAVSASLLGLLVFILLYGLKGQVVDLDPTNVYFWLVVGVLAKLPLLDRRERPAGGRPSAVGSG